MELKLKEGVDLSLLTTQYKVEVTALELLENEEAPLEQEIRLKVMISLANFITDGEVFKLLENKKDVDLYETIVKEIEPLYNQYINQNETYKEIIENVVKDIKEHMFALFQKSLSIMGVLNEMFQQIRNMSPEEVNSFKEMVNNIKLDNTKFEANKRLEQTKEAVKAETNKNDNEMDEKLAQLIEKYKTQND